MVESCNLWNDGKTVKEISNVLKLSTNTIVRYLKNGNMLDLCNNYNTDESFGRSVKKMIISVTNNIIFNSIKEAGLYYNTTNVGGISKALKENNGMYFSRKLNRTLEFKYYTEPIMDVI
jgi:hypothetical protein